LLGQSLAEVRNPPLAQDRHQAGRNRRARGRALRRDPLWPEGARAALEAGGLYRGVGEEVRRGDGSGGEVARKVAEMSKRGRNMAPFPFVVSHQPPTPSPPPRRRRAPTALFIAHRNASCWVAANELV